MVRLDRKYRVVVAALLVGGCASRPEAPSLVELHMQARGGSARVHAIGRSSCSLDLVEPTFALQADYMANRSGCMRIDVFNGGKYLQSEGVSRDGGWRCPPAMPVSPQPAGGAATLLHGIDNPTRMIGLDEFPARGHALRVAGRQALDGIAFDRIDVTYADGYTAGACSWIRPRTWSRACANTSPCTWRSTRPSNRSKRDSPTIASSTASAFPSPAAK